MNNVKTAVHNIEYAFDALRYPSDFIKKYDQLECLADSRGTETFLVKKKTMHSFLWQNVMIKVFIHLCMRAVF